MTHEPMLEGITPEMIEAGRQVSHQLRMPTIRDDEFRAIYTAMEARRPDPEAVMLREALVVAREDVLCGRDYANDAAEGELILRDGLRLSREMTTGDVERMTATIVKIDAALNPSPVLVSEEQK